MSKDKLSIRKGNRESGDYEIFAHLVNEVEDKTITEATISEFDNNLIKGDVLERYAACLNNLVVGYGVLFRAATAQDEVFSLNLIIKANYRKNGYGSILF